VTSRRITHPHSPAGGEEVRVVDRLVHPPHVVRIDGPHQRPQRVHDVGMVSLEPITDQHDGVIGC